MANIKKELRVIARKSRTLMRNFTTRARFGGSFSETDKVTFGRVLDTWRPENGRPTDILRWIMTEWCNFKCAYCDQTHGRRVPKGGGFTAHAFDNFQVEQWIDAFERHYSQRQLCLILTGGEPMLDARNMMTMLDFMSKADWCTSIRIDTNASWNPRKFDGLDKRKISLNCSYHPTQIAEAKYFANLAAIKVAGFRIGMVNYVFSRSQRDNFKRFQVKIEALDLVMNVSPEFKERHIFTKEEQDALKIDVVEEDAPYRMATVSPKGKPCLYPTISHEMSASGYVRVGCMPTLAGSFFDPQLPLFGNRGATCPYEICSCLDKYSFLAEIGRNVSLDPFTLYTARLRQLSSRYRT